MLGISHLTLLGFLTTDKVDAKDADVLVTVADNADLIPLARFPPGLFIEILRRRFANALDDARVGDGRNGLLDPLHLDLMKPFVAEVEQVTEDAIRLQIEVVQRGRARVSVPFLAFLRIGNAVVGSVGIERTLAELESIKVLIGPVERLEDDLVQLFERLVAADFDVAAALLVGEFLTDRPSRRKDRYDVQIRRG